MHAAPLAGEPQPEEDVQQPHWIGAHESQVGVWLVCGWYWVGGKGRMHCALPPQSWPRCSLLTRLPDLPRSPLRPPACLPQRLSTALYVSDFVCQFSKQLGLRALNYEHFERVLAGGWLCHFVVYESLCRGLRRSGWGPTVGACHRRCIMLRPFFQPPALSLPCPFLVPAVSRPCADATSKGGGGSADDGDYTAAALHAVYERLMHVILDDLRAEEEASAAEKRWGALLSCGTWPEVLRRLVLTRNGAEEAPHL